MNQNLLLYCIVAVVIAFVIARANRSDKLFWYLLIAFGVGAIGAAIVDGTTSKSTQVAKVVKANPMLGTSDVVSIQVSPYNTNLNALREDTGTIVPDPIGKVLLYRDNNINLAIAASKCSGETSTQFTKFHQNPLQCLSISTHHDDCSLQIEQRKLLI